MVSTSSGDPGGGASVDILTITAGREVDLVRAAVSLGVVGYLLKPFTFADLRERLEAYRRYRESLAASTTASQADVDALFRDLRRPVAAGGLPPRAWLPKCWIVWLSISPTPAPTACRPRKWAARSACRVTARRYLQYLADEGRAVRGQRLGGSGARRSLHLARPATADDSNRHLGCRPRVPTGSVGYGEYVEQVTKLAQPESRAGATLTVGDRRLIVGIAIVALLVRLSRYLPISSILVGQGYDPYVMYAASASYLWGDMPYRDFVFLHPPGVVVALVPFAMVGTVAGDAFAVGLATIASMVMGAITTALVGWFMRPYGRLAMVAAGGMYAVWNAPAYAEQMLMLEPALNLLLMAALLALRMPTNRRYFAAGALLGLSVMVKLWAAVDVLLIGAIILLTRRGKLRRSFVAGVVMGGCALGLPFFLAAPNRMWRMIVSTQLGRPHEGMTLLGRLEYFGPGPYPQHPVVLALVGVLVVGLSLYCLVVLLAAARHRAWTEHATIASIGLTHLVMIATSASFLRPLRRFPGAGAVLRARLPDGGWAPGLAQAAGRVVVGVLLVAMAVGSVASSLRHTPIASLAEISAWSSDQRCVRAHVKDLVWADAVSRNARINCEFWIDPFGVQLYLGEQLGAEQATHVYSEQRMEQLLAADALILYLEEYRWQFSAEEIALVRSRCQLAWRPHRWSPGWTAGRLRPIGACGSAHD